MRGHAVSSSIPLTREPGGAPARCPPPGLGLRAPPRQPPAPRSGHGFHLGTSLLNSPFPQQRSQERRSLAEQNTNPNPDKKKRTATPLPCRSRSEDPAAPVPRAQPRFPHADLSPSHLCGGARLPAGRTRRPRPPPFRNFSSRSVRAAPAANARGRPGPGGGRPPEDSAAPRRRPAPFPPSAGGPALPSPLPTAEHSPAPAPSRRPRAHREAAAGGAGAGRAPSPRAAPCRRVPLPSRGGWRPPHTLDSTRLASLRPGTGGRSPPAALRALGAARPPRPAAPRRAANHRDKLSPAPALARPRPQVAGEVRVRSGPTRPPPLRREGRARPVCPQAAGNRAVIPLPAHVAGRGRAGGCGLPGAALGAGAAMALPDPDPRAPPLQPPPPC